MKTLTKAIIILVGIAAMGMNSARADQFHMRKALDHSASGPGRTHAGGA